MMNNRNNSTSAVKRKVGRPVGQTDAVKLKGALGFAIDTVIEASAKGDVAASIAVVEMARTYDFK